MICGCFQIFCDVLKKGLALRPTKNRCLAATVKIIGKVPVEEIIFSKVADLQRATLPLLKNELFRMYFSKVLTVFAKHLFFSTPLSACF